jgi:serine/threonine protein kinase
MDASERQASVVTPGQKIDRRETETVDVPPDTGRELAVRCPHCHAPASVWAEGDLAAVKCSECGSDFSLISNRDASEDGAPLQSVGHFELIEKLGSGAFGTVWKARDTKLDRTVAVKIPRHGSMSADEQQKFFREARAAAQLRHPNIVSVHEVGRDGDTVYIVSDFIHGATLGDWLAGQKLTSREAAELCAKIADALHHAHEQGVVHRDLKPANIMIDAAGQPHLMDFGLARREVGEATVTLDGVLMGTPAYMSPEQAAFKSHTADRRSDVYSLGVILFELLTGERPFRGNIEMIIQQVIQDEPPSPRKLNAIVSKDLETITLKCLEKQPARRYQSAEQAAADLRRFLANVPIRARRIGRVERTIRLVSRNKTVAALLSTVVISLTAGTIVSTYFAIDALHQANVAQAREKEAYNSERTAVAVTEFLVSAFSSPHPAYDGRKITVAEVLDRAEKRLKDELANEPLHRAALYSAIGLSKRGLGLVHESVESLRQALELYQTNLGLDDPYTLIAIDNLAEAYGPAGYRAEAIILYQQAVRIRSEKLGPDHSETLTSMDKLAAAYVNAERRVEAIPYYEEAVAKRRIKLGPHHPETLSAMGRLATAYQDIGRDDEASKLYRKAFDGWSEILGEGDLNTRTPLNDIALTYGDDRVITLFVPLSKRVLDIRTAKLGPDHRDTLRSMSNLANAYRVAGRIDDAIRLYEKCLFKRRQKLGADEADTDVPMLALASIYEEAGRTKEAIRLYEEVLEFQREKFGAKLASFQVQFLAQRYLDAGRLKDAILLYLTDGYYSMALVAARRADHELMSMLIDRAIAQDVQKIPGFDRFVVGDLRLLAGDPESAEAAFRAGMEGVDVLPAGPYWRLGLALLAQGKSKEATDAFREALTTYRQVDGTYMLDAADLDEITAAYFLDVISQENFVAAFQDKKVEASIPWFFIGQRMELEGDRESAIAAYKRSVEFEDETNQSWNHRLSRWRLVELGEIAADAP